jgi:lipoprotein-anchoring transpeptidase ErfK/SrfK
MATAIAGVALLACSGPGPAAPSAAFDEAWSHGHGSAAAASPAAGPDASNVSAPATAGPPPASTAAAPADDGAATAPPATTDPAAAIDDGAPADAKELTPAELGWPADTRSVEIVATVHVRAAPSSTAPIAGKIVDGSRVAWRRVVAVADRCPRWIALVPRGWLCLDRVAPRAAGPAAEAQPVVTGRSLVPGTYYDVAAGGTVAYASAADVRGGVVKEELGTLVMVRSRGEIEIDGVDYQRTNKGLVPSGDLRPLSPSPWAGVDLRVTAPPAWPFAFARGKGRGPIALRAAPDRKAARAGSLPFRALVPYGAEQGGHVEVAPGAWAARADLRRVAIAAPPAGVGPDERWIDVDLDEQVMVAYRGATPELATLVSTGIVKGTTPIGTYRVRAMAATTRMIAEPDETKQYDVGEVPWAIRFRRGLFLHAAYWHDSFGARRSHGCVNLSPRDARALYAWVGGVPDGWSEVELERGRGVVVRIRDATHPDPPMYGYTDEAAP